MSKKAYKIKLKESIVWMNELALTLRPYSESSNNFDMDYSDNCLYNFN